MCFVCFEWSTVALSARQNGRETPEVIVVGKHRVQCSSATDCGSGRWLQDTRDNYGWTRRAASRLRGARTSTLKSCAK